MLGEALLEAGEIDEAFAILQSATNTFNEMGLAAEQAACQMAWGRYYTRVDNPAAAQTAWTQTLALSQGIMPDIAWPAHAGLAQIAAAAGDDALVMAAREFRSSPV